MTSYKDTLNLPKTDFPMKANLANREPQWLEQWQKGDVYHQLREQRRGKEPFILHDGPPYANGEIHVGHVVNKVLKDIVIKSQTLNGFDAPYVPGWDCHGLPIELKVEKQLGRAGANISPKKFREACREYAMSQVNVQRDAFQRLGILGDWDNPYLTMNYKTEANIIRALANIVDKGHLQQGAKPVHWCLDCHSALAEAEVEYEDKQSPALDISFRVLDDAAFIDRLTHSSDTAGEGPLCVPIWTTTPWTLPANQAVTLHPELEYALVQAEREQGPVRYLVADAMVKDVMLRYGIEQYRVVAYGPGKALDGLLLQHPFYDREVPIVLGHHVTTETGTGAVHTAPAHGLDDYTMAQQYDLPIDNPVLDNGCFRDDLPLFAGLHVLKANTNVIEELQRRGQLIHHEVLTHSYPHCWRHKTPIIFRATPQWFVSMDKENLRRDAVEAIFQVEWIPDWGGARLAGMIENRPDWCISRQRTWGVPLPFFLHKETKALHPETQRLMEAVAVRVEEHGIDAWFDLDPAELLGDEANEYIKSMDILDVWFDSGVTHSTVLKTNPDLHFPAHLYLEGSDQHRGWFQTSLLTSIAMNKQAPYQQVLTHGFTIDDKGRKMSKSLGNVISPDKIIKQYGADILRLWVAATDYRSELSLSDEILKRIADAYRRIRNTSRFLLSNLFDFDPEQHILPFKDLLALDQWAVAKTAALQKELIDDYNAYNFHPIYQKIHNFCALEMGSFYLDIIKDRQYTMPTDSRGRRSCQTAMYHILSALAHWLAPILSFTAEEIWQHFPGKPEHASVFLSTWCEGFSDATLVAPFDFAFWDNMMAVRDAVNKEIEIQRADGKIGSALAANVTLYCSSEQHALLQHLAEEVRFVLITSTATIVLAEAAPAEAVSTELPGLWLSIEPTSADKCERCWHRLPDVGNDKDHPELCARCVTNITGDGEKRLFA